ncbi:MAG: EAL domain-containing protein [Cyanobacteria bacterium SID2]|nr:EAL domain-containing protein [Cyanobacteria bacterium SID2]
MSLLQWQADLCQALRRNELHAHYQPIVDLETDRLMGLEALARWEHPQRGFVSPGVFIPLAQIGDRILEIDRWMLREACTQLQKWRSNAEIAQALQVSVNLTSRQLQNETFSEGVNALLAQTELQPQQLKLEITERSLLEPTEIVLQQIDRLRSIGVEFYFDDFGTGYSSLNYLHSFPVDGLKLDRAFVSKIGLDRNASEIVISALALARKLGLTVIAEGIETSTQLEYLKQWGCQYGQGYLFSRPVDADSIVPLFDRGFH